MPPNVCCDRFSELKADAEAFRASSLLVPSGFTYSSEILEERQRIMRALGADNQQWNDWKWQLRHRITSIEQLIKIYPLSQAEAEYIAMVGRRYRWCISPYYASLALLRLPENPCYKQAVPDLRELTDAGEMDPMHEAQTSPVPGVTRRYPDRLIINVTNQCAMYCRHCQRRRNFGEKDRHLSRSDLAGALRYIEENPEIRDVLVTGGDALLLNDEALDFILSELDRIPHVEIKRLGTRVPVTLPQRVTQSLCRILKKHPPIYINTQFNHPLEVTNEAAEACSRLIEAGVVLGNQAVLLKGINDDPVVMRKLNHELLKIRVRPYYIFHAKNVVGTQHLRTSVQCGIDIINSLRGHTSGLAVPTFVVNAPGGLGKVAVMPDSVVEHTDEYVILRTWEGKLVTIPETSGV